jgi:hypothetical protein
MTWRLKRVTSAEPAWSYFLGVDRIGPAVVASGVGIRQLGGYHQRWAAFQEIRRSDASRPPENRNSREAGSASSRQLFEVGRLAEVEQLEMARGVGCARRRSQDRHLA